MIDNPAVTDWLGGVWENSRAGLLTAARDPDAALAGKFGEALRQLGETLQTEPALKRDDQPVRPPRDGRRGRLLWRRHRHSGFRDGPLAGTRAPSPTGSKTRSAATSNISASTAPWSAAWSASPSTRSRCWHEHDGPDACARSPPIAASAWSSRGSGRRAARITANTASRTPRPARRRSASPATASPPARKRSRSICAASPSWAGRPRSSRAGAKSSAPVPAQWMQRPARYPSCCSARTC